MPRSGTVAFAGAGGKTSAIRRLLREDPDSLATTTTHLALSGFGHGLLAATPVAAGLDSQLASLRARPLTVALHASGPRLHAPPLEWLHGFLSRSAGSRVFVEADGAARHLLKLPATEEPAWPPAEKFLAVVVLGLDSLGEPSRQVLHRPEAFARAGLRASCAGWEHAQLMLRAYLRTVPPLADVCLLLTGARTSLPKPELAVFARHALRQVRRRDPRLADPGVAVRVVATSDLDSKSFQYWSWKRPTAPRQRLPGVCGVLLAAGSGSRFSASRGKNKNASKLLSIWRGRTLIEHAVANWCEAGFSELVVVLGHDERQIEPLVRRAARGAHSAVRIVRNTQHSRGLGTSVRAAVRAATPGLALLFGHADMPALRPRALWRIADLGSSLRRWIVVPMQRGAPRNPAYFPPDLRPELLQVPDAGGGKSVYASHPERVFRLELGDAPDLADVDRPEDLERLHRMGGRP